MSKSIQFEVNLPLNNSYSELLRFYCQTCKADDPSLGFMSNMWSYANSRGNLTGKQAVSADAYIEYRFKELGLLLSEVDNYEE